MIVSPTVVEEDGDIQVGGKHTFSDVCARVVKIFHMSIPKIPTSRDVEPVTTAGDTQVGGNHTFSDVCKHGRTLFWDFKRLISLDTKLF